MAGTPALMIPSHEVDKLSYEIFSILESKFLFGYDDPKFFLSGNSPETPAKTPKRPAISLGKVRILSIDAAGDGFLAAASLARLETCLRCRSGDPAARIADFFDIAAGSGVGGVLATMLFTRGPEGRSLYSAEEALCFLAKNGPPSAPGRKGLLRGIFQPSSAGSFRRIFGDTTLRDTVKPVLIPCYDLSTGAPFLFSRADAVETDAYDFLIREVCAATCAGEELLKMSSIDGRTRISAVGGGLAMANPTAAAITHVLHNKQEFPFAGGVEDLLVVSIAGGEIFSAGSGAGVPSPSSSKLLRIAGNGMADTVDQAVAMAFLQNGTNNCNYVRIQAHGHGLQKPLNREVKKTMAAVQEILQQKSTDSMLFHGRKLSQQSNAEKLEQFAGKLIKEHDWRKKSPIPIVVLKQMITPRTSSATTITSTVTSSTTTSGSP
ncbi:Patatin group A-3 [Apostasia shenzhenica]|uniref:Patatin n=1 Tax=Apostasia shenzhenica TaxID=1088818 RepID=A0A2I0BE00_9ASPA|nr:Patatin group A-3 [Apostasia shenzhenica]